MKHAVSLPQSSHRFCALLLGFVALAGSASALEDPASLPANKRAVHALHLTASAAYVAVSNNPQSRLFIDVRTTKEVAQVGAPAGVDRQVPLFEERAGSLHRNENFVAMIEQQLAAKGLSKSDPVYVICRDGVWGARAANLLAGAGFMAVYTVTDGTEGDPDRAGEPSNVGWRVRGLPWRSI